MATISVFIPTYNYGHFLPKCLDSVIKQTRKTHQIIVADDYSTDNTQEIMKRYQGKVEYVRHNKKFGNNVLTYNTGLKRAKGDYVLFISADDWIEPKLLEKEAAILDQNPQIGLVYAQAFTVTGNQKNLKIASPAGKTSYLGRNNDFALLLTKGDFIPYMTALVRKSVYDRVGLFDTRLTYLADLDMWIRIAKDYPLAYLAQPLAYYRLHKSNIHFNRRTHDFEKEFFLILKKYHNLLKNPIIKPILCQAFYNYYLNITNFEIASGNYQRAKIFWKKAVKLNPGFFWKISAWKPVYFTLRNRLKKWIH